MLVPGADGSVFASGPVVFGASDGFAPLSGIVSFFVAPGGAVVPLPGLLAVGGSGFFALGPDVGFFPFEDLVFVGFVAVGATGVTVVVGPD